MFVILWEELAPTRILIMIASVLMVAQLRLGRIPLEPVLLTITVVQARFIAVTVIQASLNLILDVSIIMNVLQAVTTVILLEERAPISSPITNAFVLMVARLMLCVW